MEVIANWNIPLHGDLMQQYNNIDFSFVCKPLNLRIQRLTDTAKLPQKSHPTDACFDIYADIPHEEYCVEKEMTLERLGKFVFNDMPLTESGKGVAIKPHQTVLIPTGFATEIPHGFWGAIFARSGLTSKQGLRPAQGVPVIDESYRGQWFIPLYNQSDEVQIIHHGDRICQFMLLPYFDTTLTEVSSLSSTDRGEGGFGSSGV